MLTYTNTEGETFLSYEFKRPEYDRGLIKRYAPEYDSTDLLYINYFPSTLALQLGIVVDNIPYNVPTYKIYDNIIVDHEITNISLDEFDNIKTLMSYDVIETCDGPIVFTGKIDEEAEIIFTCGLCANFAKVLQQRCNYLHMYYTIESCCGITHMFCYNPSNGLYYDITDSWTKEQYKKTWGYDTIFQPCPTMEIYYATELATDSNDKYAEVIMDEYITMHQL